MQVLEGMRDPVSVNIGDGTAIILYLYVVD